MPLLALKMLEVGGDTYLELLHKLVRWLKNKFTKEKTLQLIKVEAFNSIVTIIIHKD